MKKKTKVLITNDDGIFAPGIKHLWNAIKDTYETTIIAPATEKSGVGLCYTFWDPVHAQEVFWDQQTPAWKISGTPSDCVRLGINDILSSAPDIVLSGINKGSNAGRTVLYSGTIGGVIEAVMNNVPGIAFSSQDYENPNYDKFEKYIHPIIEYVLNHPLPQGAFLNVNFPSTEVKGFKLTRQGMSLFSQTPRLSTHPEGFKYYWMHGKWQDHEECSTSDVHALNNGYISAAPIFVKDLTHEQTLASRKDHFENLLNA
jgi:5'-nucleotidase